MCVYVTTWMFSVACVVLLAIVQLSGSTKLYVQLYSALPAFVNYGCVVVVVVVVIVVVVYGYFSMII